MLLAELKRRKVFKVVAAYGALAWLAVQAASIAFPAFDAPAWALRVFILVTLLGAPLALVMAWIFDVTPEGVRLEPAQAGNKRVIGIALALMALALGWYFLGAPALRRDRAPAAATPAPAAATPPAQPQPLPHSIAVLPFVDMSQGKDQEYLSDGVAEELLNLLAKVPELSVISRSSSFSFKGKDVDVPTIAKRLNVAHVMEGSVRKAGNQVRITVQLIDARSDTHLWSETYDRPLDDIFAIQDEIATAVVAQLKVKLLGAAPKARATDPQAYALYLQARSLAQQGTAAALARSIPLYQESLSIAPDYAPAWLGLSNTYTNQAGKALRPADEGKRLSREAALKAVELDPGYAAAHAALARVAFQYDHDLPAAARHVTQALALEPGSLEAVRTGSRLLRSLGRLDEAIAVAQYVTARDPANPVGFSVLGNALHYAGRDDEAVASFRTAMTLSPEYAGGRYNLGMSELGDGSDPRRAEQALATIRAEPIEAYRLIGLAMAQRVLGHDAESQAALAQLSAKYEREAAFNIAFVHAFRHEPDQAFAWLDKAVQYEDVGLADVVVQPALRSLHADPRWVPFLEKIGFAPAQVAAVHLAVPLPEGRGAGAEP